MEIAIHTQTVPIIPEAKDYAAMGLIPEGSYATKHFCEHLVEVRPGLETVLLDLMFDPQTSGGLIIALAPDEAGDCLNKLRKGGVESAAIIGEVIGHHPQGRLRID